MGIPVVRSSLCTIAILFNLNRTVPMRSGGGVPRAAALQSARRRTNAGRMHCSRATLRTGGSDIAFRNGHFLRSARLPSAGLKVQYSTTELSASRRSGIRTHAFGIGTLPTELLALRRAGFEPATSNVGGTERPCGGIPVANCRGTMGRVNPHPVRYCRPFLVLVLRQDVCAESTVCKRTFGLVVIVIGQQKTRPCADRVHSDGVGSHHRSEHRSRVSKSCTCLGMVIP